MFAVLYLVLALASATAFYLSSRHQQLRAVANPRQLRAAGWLLLALAWAAAWRALGFWGGGFAMLTAFMLAAVIWPYLNAYLATRRSAGQTPRKNEEVRHVG